MSKVKRETLNTFATLIGKILPKTNSSVWGSLWLRNNGLEYYSSFLIANFEQQVTLLLHSQRQSTIASEEEGYYLTSC